SVDPSPPGKPELSRGGQTHGPNAEQRGQVVGACLGPPAAGVGSGVMNPTREWSPELEKVAQPVATAGKESSLPLDDPRVIQAVREYLAALEAGKKPDRLSFLGRFPEIAGPLAECLDALEFMHAASPFAAEKGASTGATAIGPEGVPLGDYRILREIGRGGMGVVYEAQQMSLGRR